MQLVNLLYITSYIYYTLAIDGETGTIKGCLIPNENVTLTDAKTKIELKPGTLVPQLTLVEYSCKKQHSLEGNIKTNFCYNDWINSHPKCKKTCPEILHHTIEVHCEYKGEPIDCSTSSIPGTIANINCAYMYRKPKNKLFQEYLQCQYDGTWNYEPNQCEEICGTADTYISPNVNNTLTVPNQVPWNVAIYSKRVGKYDHICGGTIIQSKIIISAATCFWDTENVTLYDTSHFIVGVGKSNRDYYMKNETLEVQMINISKIHIPFTFRGAKADYLSNIAILTLHNHIIYKNHIRPVCWKMEQQNSQSIPNSIKGVFAAWDTPGMSNLSPNFNSVLLSAIDYNSCKKKFMKDRPYLSIPYDKFCIDNSGGRNICYGTGGGLVVQRQIDGTNFYYLKGILSNGVLLNVNGTPDCLTNLVPFLTDIQYYTNFIDNAISNKLSNSSTIKENKTDIISGCLVPIGNIILTNSKTKIQLQPGTFVPPLTSIDYLCSTKYILEGPAHNLCNKDWENSHSECIKTCPPIRAHTIEVHCTFRRKVVDCSKPSKPGTSAFISCATMYRKPRDRIVYEDIHCQKDGEWSYTPFECEQICGTVGNIVPLSVGGKITRPEQVPWHVGIYSKAFTGKYDFICGGTIIESKIVISAAQCFWNSIKSTLHDISTYVVTAGKFHRDYYANNESLEFQKLNVSKVDIPITFSGGQFSYLSDIAVVTLNDHIKYKNHIRPACLEWEHKNKQFLFENVSGIIAGWGVTETDGITPDLLSIKMFAIDSKTCQNEVAPGEKYYISDDKFCIKGKHGEVLCEGDSAGGFVVEENFNGNSAYYLRGVLSTILIVSGNYSICGKNTISAVTNIEYYEQLIKTAINRTLTSSVDPVLDNRNAVYSMSSSLGTMNATTSSPVGCYIPTGNIIVITSKSKHKLDSGTQVSFGTSIEYSCPKKHTLVGSPNNICRKVWEHAHPVCQKICEQIGSRTTEIHCYYGGVEVDCYYPIKAGTFAKITCATMYAKPRNQLIHEDIYCQSDGEWNYEPFKCEQICGTIDNKIPYSVNSQPTLPNQVPWHAGIYIIRNSGYHEQICGGTLIQSKIVISAAHCFWNPSESVIYDKSKFVVTVGKFYRDFYSINETLENQKMNVSEIDIPVTFFGAQHDFANDIAVLTLVEHVEYKKHISPACLIWREQSDQYIQSNLAGVIAGWGITDNGKSSTELRSVELLSIDNYTCKTKKIRRTDRISGDKFCVETSSGKNVCSGDSGGGYVVPETINDVTFYHLWGVVSNGIIPRGGDIIDCNSNLTTTFTNIQFYKEIVNNAIIRAY